MFVITATIQGRKLYNEDDSGIFWSPDRKDAFEYDSYESADEHCELVNQGVLDGQIHLDSPATVEVV